MPAYDYACTVCGTGKEIKAPMGSVRAQEALPCDSCDRPTLHRRQFGATAVRFKGTGFYKTDSRDDIEQWQFRHLEKD